MVRPPSSPLPPIERVYFISTLTSRQQAQTDFWLQRLAWLIICDWQFADVCRQKPANCFPISNQKVKKERLSIGQSKTVRMLSTKVPSSMQRTVMLRKNNESIPENRFEGMHCPEPPAFCVTSKLRRNVTYIDNIRSVQFSSLTEVVGGTRWTIQQQSFYGRFCGRSLRALLAGKHNDNITVHVMEAGRGWFCRACNKPCLRFEKSLCKLLYFFSDL